MKNNAVVSKKTLKEAIELGINAGFPVNNLQTILNQSNEWDAKGIIHQILLTIVENPHPPYIPHIDMRLDAIMQTTQIH